MILNESEIIKIIKEETLDILSEGRLLKEETWKIPSDNKYEYSLTPDGTGYIAYENGKALGTFTDDAGLKKVKDAAPAADTDEDEQSWGDWFKEKLGYGDEEQKETPQAQPAQEPERQPKSGWDRESKKDGPIHKLQTMLGFTGVQIDGIFGKNSKTAWANQTDDTPLPSSPEDAIQLLAKAREPEESGGLYQWLFGSDDEDAVDQDAQQGLVFYDKLPDNLKADKESLMSGKGSIIARCTDNGCAQYVSDTLKTTGGSRGNAWHQHRLSTLRYTAFLFDHRKARQAAELLTRIESNPRNNHEKEVKEFVKTFIPRQMPLSKVLRLGDIVGLYYEDSHNFTKAFREAATATHRDSSGRATRAAADGPFFLKKNGKWVPGETILGKKDSVSKGKSKVKTTDLGKGFGMNTHLGFVGALYNDEPIIFHQVYGSVYAEPLSYVATDASKIKVMWTKEAHLEGDKGEKVVSEELSKGASTITSRDEIRAAIQTVSNLKEFLLQTLSTDEQTLNLLTIAAVGITGRESDFGYGKRYAVTDWLERAASYLKIIDASVGPAQMRHDMHFGDDKAEFKDFAKQVGITSAFSLSSYTKSLLGCVAILSSLYKKAIKEGYDPTKPGAASVDFVSTGNGALDISIIGYNVGASVVTSYCGGEKVKVKCKDLVGTPHFIRAPPVINYIPNYKKQRGDRTLTTIGYVSEVASNMKAIGTIKI